MRIKRIKLLILILFIFTLFACRSMQQRPNEELEEKNMRAARINTQLAIAYLERHDIIRAKQKLVLAMDEGPTLPETWYTMAYFLEATGNRVQAKDHYLKAISLAPNRGDTHNNYGTFLCRTHHYQEAIQHFLIAVRDPKYLDPASAYENAGLCALKIDPLQAKNFFIKALMENPNRPNALISLAELNYKDRKYNAAKEALHRYLKISPPNSQSMALMDKIYAKL